MLKTIVQSDKYLWMKPENLFKIITTPMLFGVYSGTSLNCGQWLTLITLMNLSTASWMFTLIVVGLQMVLLHRNFISGVGTNFMGQVIASAFNRGIRNYNIEDAYSAVRRNELDRQHPRDLFDIKLLNENEGITKEITIAFVFYLISHDRPIFEVLNPSLLDIEKSFSNEFIGMTIENVSLEELLNVRKTQIIN